MDANTALNQINARNNAGNPMSVTELRNLAGQVDVSAGNATLLLYSGGVGDDLGNGQRQFGARPIAENLADGINTKTIGDTEIGKFLNNRDVFQNALNSAAISEGKILSDILEGKDSSGNRINSNSFF